MKHTLQHSISAQRAVLHDLLSDALGYHAEKVQALIDNRSALEGYLFEIFQSIDHCKYVYVLDATATQISATVNRYGADHDSINRDRSQRPYMQPMRLKNLDFHLSEAYISRNKKRPSLTAIQSIRNADGDPLGFLGVDFDLRELPHSDVIYEEPSQWRQIQGDPAIRQGLFLQERIESLMDRQIDNVLSVHTALMVDQGVHHVQIHFSSSRSTIWHIDDPYVYRLLTMEELSDSNICLAYPRRSYFKRAIVPPSSIAPILKQFKALRFADETVYLRSASLNTINGQIGLNFSCDGTHYLSHDEFLDQGLDFWFGTSDRLQTVTPAKDSNLDHLKLDTIIETLAGKGCIKVNKLIYAMESGDTPEVLQAYSEQERHYIYAELKSVMDVYEGGVCNI